MLCDFAPDSHLKCTSPHYAWHYSTQTENYKGPQAIVLPVPLTIPDKCKRLSEKGHQFQIYSKPRMQMNPATSTLDGRRLGLTATVRVVRAVVLTSRSVADTDNSCVDITTRIAQKLNRRIKNCWLEDLHWKKKKTQIVRKSLYTCMSCFFPDVSVRRSIVKVSWKNFFSAYMLVTYAVKNQHHARLWRRKLDSFFFYK